MPLGKKSWCLLLIVWFGPRETFGRKRKTSLCDSAPCRNGGQCIDLTSPNGDRKFQCSCLEGFSGITCQKRIDPCEEEPCQNDGRCVARGEHYHCVCAKGFQGKDCDKKERVTNSCSGKPCGAHGICEVINDDFICECLPGHSGPRCENRDIGPLKVPVEAETSESSLKGVVIGLLVCFIIIVIIFVFVGCHCLRVIARRSDLKAAQERRKSLGFTQSQVPSLLEVSNELCRNFFCCGPTAGLDEVAGVIVPVHEYHSMMSVQQGADDPLAPINGNRPYSMMHAPPYADSNPQAARSRQVSPQVSSSGPPMHPSNSVNMTPHDAQENIEQYPDPFLEHDQQTKRQQSRRTSGSRMTSGIGNSSVQAQFGSTGEDRHIVFRESDDRHPSTWRDSRYYRSTPSLANSWANYSKNNESLDCCDRHGPGHFKARHVRSANTTPRTSNKQRSRKPRTFTRHTTQGYAPLIPRSWSYPVEQTRYVRRTPKAEKDFGAPTRLRDGERHFYDVRSPEVPGHDRLQFSRMYGKVDHEEEDVPGHNRLQFSRMYGKVDHEEEDVPGHDRLQFSRMYGKVDHEEEDDDVADYSADDTGQSDLDHNRLSDDGYGSTSKFSERDSAARHNRSYQIQSSNVRMAPRFHLKDYNERSKNIPFSRRLVNHRRQSRLPPRHSPDKSASSRETSDEEEVAVESLSRKRETFRKPGVWRHFEYASHPEDVALVEGKSRSVTKIRRGDLMEACGRKPKYPDPVIKPQKLEIRRKGILKKGSTSNNKNDNHTIYSYATRVQRQQDTER